MKTFSTRIDLADDRQVKQKENTQTTFSGSINTLQYTTLGQNYVNLKTGIDISSSGYTDTSGLSYISFTFTGTTGSTTYFGISSPYTSIISNLPTITDQNYNEFFTVSYFDSIQSVVVDGNTFDILFSGSEINFNVISGTFGIMGTNQFSGQCYSNYIYTVSASTYDWYYLKNGSTTWLDVLGRANFDKLSVESNGVPSTSGDTGITGTITWDNGYLYVCVATNTWKRCQLSTW